MWLLKEQIKSSEGIFKTEQCLSLKHDVVVEETSNMM